jgi:hypothetical protein
MLKHNDLVRLSLGHVPVGPNMLRIIEWSPGLLRKAGIPDQAAAYFGDMLGRYLDVSVLEVTAAGGPPIEQVGRYFAGLRAEQFPNITGLSAAMFSGDHDDRFEFGLDLLVRGLGAYTLASTTITEPHGRPVPRQPAAGARHGRRPARP